MSRTPHHNAQKTFNREYWSRRSTLCGQRTPGRITKVATHRAERRLAVRLAKALEEMAAGQFAEAEDMWRLLIL